MKKYSRLFAVVLVLLLAVSLSVSALAAGNNRLTFIAPATNPATAGWYLNQVTLTGGSASLSMDGTTVEIPGTFAWSKPDTYLGEGGGFYYDCVFTPADNAYGLTPETLQVLVAVYRINLQIPELPTAAAITAGQKLSESALTGGSAHDPFNRNVVVPGAFQWVNGDEEMTAEGSYERAVVFVPENGAIYNPTTTTYERLPSLQFAPAMVTVTVNAAAEEPTEEPAETEPAPEPTPETPAEPAEPTEEPAAPSQTPAPEENGGDQGGSNLWWLWVLLGAAALGGGGYALYSHNKNKKNEE